MARAAMRRIELGRRIGLCLLLGALTSTIAGCGVAAALPAGGAAWKISLVAQPTSLPPSGHTAGEPSDQYVLMLTNMGSVESSGTITLADRLPPAVVVGEEIQSPGWTCQGGLGSVVVTCSYSGAVPALGQSAVLTIPVAVGAEGPLPDSVTVSGGSAPTATANLTTTGSATIAAFGFLDFTNQTSDLFGAPDTQAGDHPYALTTAFDFPQREVKGTPSPEQAVQLPRAMEIDLPAGLVGNPQAASRCTMVALLAKNCPSSSRVGTSFIDFGTGLAGGPGPIYNVFPEHGYPAEFGLYDEKVNRPVFLYGSVRTGSDYGLRVIVPNIPPAARATNLVVTFFGDPQRMDGGANASIPFFTNPSDCSREPLLTNISTDTWEEPERWISASPAQALPVGNCGLLQFQPAIKVTPTTAQADEPTGFGVDLQIPQPQSTGVEGLTTPPLKDATVVLPQGVALSPAAGDGLTACPAEGPEGINLTSAVAGNCPLTSQIGTVQATTPLLESPLTGHVYVAQPGCGGAGQSPCTETDAQNGTLYSVYLELEGSGVVVKQHGTASVNSTTGQISTSFKDAPQQPFSDLKLTLADSPRAPLANPQTCGEALASSDMRAWSSPQTPDATPSWEFPVGGCEGPPFAPTFQAGTSNTAGGAYTTLRTTFNRVDRMQDLGAIQVQTPPGLLGMLAHVSLCEEPLAASGACPEASRIGAATASAGSGSHPLWESGPVYLTGPYKGAPFGLSVAIPAKAGPFDLGTVVARATINVDVDTATVTITSDPLPQIVDGVPLRVQTVNVAIDRPQFIFNSTSCTAQQITATITSAQGAVAHDATPYAAGGCQHLPFKPSLKLVTQAKTSKAKGASLTVTVALPSGSANIRRVDLRFPKQLPARLKTLQQACTDAQFALNPAGCPPGSNIGTATAISPVLSVPLTGPVYLVSHGGAGFPDVVFILQGQGLRIDVTGKTDIVKGVTYSKFETVPDAPVSSFTTNLPEGPHSVLSANGSLCAKKLSLPTTIEGQNGALVQQSTKLTVTGCPKAKRATKKT